MKKLAILVLVTASSADADASTIDSLPLAKNAANVADISPVARWDGPWANQCVLSTEGDHGIALRWLPGESAIERTAFSMYRRDEEGKLEREPPQWAYEPIVIVESVTKVSPIRVAEASGAAVFAYREANSLVLLVPGKSGTTLTTSTQRGATSCATATAALSTLPASECKTTTGCGRFARITGSGFAVTAGVRDGALSVSVRTK